MNFIIANPVSLLVNWSAHAMACNMRQLRNMRQISNMGMF